MGLANKIKNYGELVMFSHSLFSLPFAMISMIWAAGGFPEPRLIALIIVALFAGRNGANAINRVIDSPYDKINPRVAHRHIPQNIVTEKEASILSAVLFLIFSAAAHLINPLCFYLSPIALFLFVAYSYTKRFTWACHLILGITCAGAPFGAWIAVTGKLSYEPFLISSAVALWIGGFDVLYGTQDIDFDKKLGLYSIPAYFGYKNSLKIAAFFHAASWLILFSLFFVLNNGYIYLTGLIIIGVLFATEHRLVRPGNAKFMNWASYHINQIVSVIFFIFSFLDFWLRRGF
ncbi:UbiA-like polyprenyltransferase [Alkalibacter saccharofermentans]|uniref:4-hydroxybenzoate polyprenyltransferase n=1 Tax=Alkalibacter saccharofermentans DSM 14828 TaxID=1120975 RepID=A0A1M4YWU5_9FIRM|nr:UbiA-like polyprenyltransferase [Alkalibacter saccharofermentans]SHF10271.1 4-hydroxybenzoate polyprenyltransferase [Alkalibacter saccharofermentans DSM 14828]